MSEDESNTVSTNSTNPIATHQDIIKKYALIDEVMPFNVPSPHITINHVKTLKSVIENQQNSKHYDGFIITHGTDTLEETAFLLDLTLSTTKPVILTGAMRSSNEIGSDGLYNFISAIRVAITDEANHKGVMVVFNDEIHTARNVTKTHTSNTNTFQSPNHGPLGIITKFGIQFHYQPNPHRHLQNINPELNIALVKAHMGMESEILEYYAEKEIDGLIVEALGQGNIPPAALKGLNACLKKKIPIVVVSRSFNGIVSPVYAYDGGGNDLYQKGVIFSNGLNGPKARLKLLVALSNQFHKKDLARYFYE